MNSLAVKTYRMTPKGAAQFAGFGRVLTWIIWCSAAILFVSVVWGEGSKPEESSDPQFVLVVFLIVFVPAGILVLLQRRSFSTSVRHWASLEIDVGEDFILRRQEDLPEIRLSREEVTHLYNLGDGGVIVRAGSRHRQILIPKGIDDYDELRARLFQWKHPESATRQRLSWILSLGCLLAFAVGHVAPTLTNNQHLIALAHTVAAASFLFVFYEYQKSPQVSKGGKRLSWIFLLLAVLEGWAVYNRLAGL